MPGVSLVGRVAAPTIKCIVQRHAGFELCDHFQCRRNGQRRQPVFQFACGLFRTDRRRDTGQHRAGIEPRLCMASSPITIERALIRKEAVAWRPSAMALGRPDLPEGWEVTSDSLACWLAEELCARRLVLVKSAEPPGNDRGVEALAEAGYVDAAFPGFLKRFRGGAACIAAADHAAAEAAIAAGRDFGIPIEPA